VWDAATGASLAELKGHTSVVNSAAFSPDGTRIVTASDDQTARVWDAATGASLAELKGHADSVYSVAFSPDGTRIVTASWDQTARVWDAATGASLAELKGHTGSVHSAAFSPDGTRILTGSRDGTARVWDSVPYRERFPAIQRARAAARKMGQIVQARLKAGEPIDGLRAALNADATLAIEERAASLAELQSVLDQQRRATEVPRAEANRLNTAAWNAVRFAPVVPDAAIKAVADARRAVELAPGNILILNTLGVALFRAGDFMEALETLHRSDAANVRAPGGPQPSDWAFIAMSHWKLGDQAQAHAALAILRDLAATDRWKDDEETIRFLEEARTLITPPLPAPPQADGPPGRP